MLVMVSGAELERLMADRDCLDSPYVGPMPKSQSGRIFADWETLKVWREKRYKLVGYAPGQAPQ